MRDYAKVSPNFWTGQTGRRIVAAGPDCITVSMYLMTTGHANMIGIYYCPLAYICHDTGLSHEGALKALQRASEAGFCAYDEGSGWVYVPKMALWQIGSELKASDNQVKAIRKEYERLPNNPFLKRFFEDYGEAYHLETERVFEGPSKPLTNPLRSQEQEQEQEQEQALPSSLRSDSSSAPPADPPDGLKLVSPNPESKAERLAAVTKDAIETFNAAGFTKANGGAVPNVSPTVGVDKRRQQVSRCVKTAREICREQFGQPVVTREFWDAYWTEVAADDFLSGRQAGGPGHENWRPDFEYLTRPATMLKVYERAAAA
jgi:hypothetical protein